MVARSVPVACCRAREGLVTLGAVLDAETLREEGRLRTRAGARTGFFSRELDLLFVAVPADQNNRAEVRAYRPR